MPKASFAAKDTVEVTLGIQEGVVEITKAITKVHQYPPNKQSGEQGEPFPCVQLTCLRCNESGDRVDDTEIEEQLGLGKLDKWHPGKADGPDDNDPEDAGEDVDAEGNCVYVVDPSAKLNKKSKWVIFATSLEDHGFKASILERGYMPDLVGLKVKVKSIPGTKIPGQTYKKDPINLVAEKILVFPYEKGKGKPAAKVNGKPNVGSTPAAPASSKTADGAEQMAMRFLEEAATDYSGKEIERRKLPTAVQAKLMKAKIPVAQHRGVIDLVKDDDWLRAATAENEDSPIFGKLVVDFDADPQTVAFQ